MKKRLLALAQSAATALPVAAQGPVTERQGHPLADGGQAPKAPPTRFEHAPILSLTSYHYWYVICLYFYLIVITPRL